MLTQTQPIDISTRTPANNMERTRRPNLFASNAINYFRLLFKQAPGFIAFLSGPDHVYEMVNDEYIKMAGGRDVIGKSMREALPELAEQGYDKLLDQVYATGEPYIGKHVRILLPDGSDGGRREVYIDFIYEPVRDDKDTVIGILLFGIDRTRQIVAEGELRIVNENWKNILESTGEGVWEWNPVTNAVHYSHNWYAMLGFKAEEIEQTYAQWDKLVHPEDKERVLADVMACFSGKTAFLTTEYRMRRHDGKWAWLLSRGLVTARDLQGNPLRLIGTNTDITDKKIAENNIWNQANFDLLTGLPNRRLFYDRLAHEIVHANRSGTSIALFFVDLDNFKQANDLLGHKAGDVLLCQAADRIEASIRQSDTVARLGGDEFTVIVTDINDTFHVDSVAQKIIEKLGAPFVLGPDTVYLSGSIGITLYPQDAIDIDALLNNADQAMYAAKGLGKNQFCYFTHEMQSAAQARLRLTSDLRSALASGDQLKVYYQPIIDFSTGKIAKAEALVRWFHPDLGLIYPTDFIGIAEESGLIHQLGEWVFREAAGWSLSLMKSGHDLIQVSVNKSPVQFSTSRNDLNWPAYLAESGLPSDRIAIEITENMLLKGGNNVDKKLLQYRDAGIQVALDDFGTGFSSMSYLKKFDIDILKIDQSFVKDIVTNSDSRTIAKSIILMGHELGLKVIAEGIETQAQHEFLHDAGCDFGQGFLFSSAVSSVEFERLLAQA